MKLSGIETMQEWTCLLLKNFFGLVFILSNH